ncbi:hypothetical protein G7Y31_11480 [Corynebacterium lizhenjunii]|uniref:Uncharacterized protein n=1 Tax=Corynebacterium lizhenjunii TaxID=2709394 RepID=A0A7T0KEY8_9CORY|nr:hypothetical protein [Corynebacterium lizhenjunii]QPK79091.1 hypothetical protein G7Y31_11480 [Corynebacterium lizhenjunii]
MNPAYVVTITPQPEALGISRMIAIPAETTMGELTAMVDAAMGLETNGPGELQASSKPWIRVADIHGESAAEFLTSNEQILYTADTDGLWQLFLTYEATTTLPSALPALIDATGPDLLPAAGSIPGMVQFLYAVQALLAGKRPQPRPLEKIMHAFPNFSIEQMRLRLTECYAPDIIDRLREASGTAALLQHEKFLSTEQMLAELLQKYPELASDYDLPPLQLEDKGLLYYRYSTFLYVLQDHPELTESGLLAPEAVAELVESFGIDSQRGNTDEETVIPIRALRELFDNMCWIKLSKTHVHVTEDGLRALEEPVWGVRALLRAIPLAYDPDAVPAVCFHAVHLLRGETLEGAMPQPLELAEAALEGLGILRAHPTYRAPEEGLEGVLAEIVRFLREQLRFD